jgi:hypothetical protein
MLNFKSNHYYNLIVDQNITNGKSKFEGFEHFFGFPELKIAKLDHSRVRRIGESFFAKHSVGCIGFCVDCVCCVGFCRAYVGFCVGFTYTRSPLRRTLLYKSISKFTYSK